MKPTLEEERRALLEQIEASRNVYRRMLTGNPPQANFKSPQTGARSMLGPDFPRSHTMRWLIAHRWQLALGALAIVLVIPGRRLINQNTLKKIKSMPGSSSVKALGTAGVSLLRSRNSLHLAGRIAGLLLRWMQQQRTHQVTGK